MCSDNQQGADCPSKQDGQKSGGGRGNEPPRR
jgi:hypothetical protein